MEPMKPSTQVPQVFAVEEQRIRLRAAQGGAAEQLMLFTTADEVARICLNESTFAGVALN